MTVTTGIAEMTMEQTGWSRIDSNSMQWVGPPEMGERDILHVLARVRAETNEDVLLIKSAVLDDDDDPADSECVADVFEFGGKTIELSRPAVFILHSVLGSWLRAVESRQPRPATAREEALIEDAEEAEAYFRSRESCAVCGNAHTNDVCGSEGCTCAALNLP